MDEKIFNTGAKIGWLSASWPLARLTISKEKIKINCLGEYAFNQDEIVRIEKYGKIPVVSTGLRFVHNRADYPKNIVIYSAFGSGRILEAINNVGFQPLGLEKVFPRGLPIKLPVIIGIVVLWNALFLIDLKLQQEPTLGIFSVVAMFLMFIFCTMLKASASLRKLVIKEGRSLSEIRSSVTLVQIVSAFVALGSLMVNVLKFG